MRRTVVGALALVTVLSALVGGPVAARADCAGTGYAETFEVSAKPRRPVYRIGQTAVIDLAVTDSVTGLPVSDADAGLIIRGRGKKSPFAVGNTGDEGHVVLRLRLKRSDVKPGWAKTFAAAWESIDTPAYCTGRYGYREYPRLFRIRG